MSYCELYAKYMEGGCPASDGRFVGESLMGWGRIPPWVQIGYKYAPAHKQIKHWIAKNTGGANHIQQQRVMSTNISNHHKVKEQLEKYTNWTKYFWVLTSKIQARPSAWLTAFQSVANIFVKGKTPRVFLLGAKIRCTMNKKLNNCALTSYKQIHCSHLSSAMGNMHCSKNYIW